MLSVPPAYRIVIYRRFMTRIPERTEVEASARYFYKKLRSVLKGTA